MNLKGKMIMAISLFMSGCASHAYYKIGLKEVTQPADSKLKFGTQKISSSTEGNVQKQYFEDNVIKIFWMPTAGEFSFGIENKTNNSIHIIWDEAAYVDKDGKSHRVSHGGVRMADRNSAQAPSVVTSKSKFEDFIIPTDNIDWDGGWNQRPLFPEGSFSLDGGGKKSLERSAGSYIGKTIKIVLPLKIQDVVNEYVFVFNIDDVQIR